MTRIRIFIPELALQFVEPKAEKSPKDPSASPLTLVAAAALQPSERQRCSGSPKYKDQCNRIDCIQLDLDPSPTLASNTPERQGGRQRPQKEETEGTSPGLFLNSTGDVKDNV